MNKDIMELEEAKSYLETVIKVNNSVIKEARKNGDINTIELTADLDCQSIAIETVLQALEKLQQDNYKLDRENQQLFESKINSISKKKIEDSIKFLTSRDNFDFVGTEWRESEVVDFLKQLLEG